MLFRTNKDEIIAFTTLVNKILYINIFIPIKTETIILTIRIIDLIISKLLIAFVLPADFRILRIKATYKSKTPANKSILK